MMWIKLVFQAFFSVLDTYFYSCLVSRLSKFTIGLLGLLMPVLLLVSCQGDGNDSAEPNEYENWAELFFEERLASITGDSDSARFYIGTEDGVVFVYSKEGIVKYNTPFNRIYCVRRDREALGYYWVGTRNMGLKRCQLKGDSLVKVQSYTIPVKGDRYSVYDICYHNDTLYLGTSNGLFHTSPQKSLSGNLELEVCWKKGNLGDPVVVRKLCSDGEYLFFTTEKGILKRKGNVNDTVIPDVADVTFFPSLCKSDDGVKALIDNTLYSFIGEKVLPTTIDHMCMDFLQSNNNLYQVSGKDSLFVNGVGRILPSPARQECRNLIADDPLHDQVLLVTSHHLLRIPHHYTLPNWGYNHVSVSASCTDENGNAFFLLGSNLFELKHGDSIAEEIFSCQYPPTLMTTCNGQFYFVSNGQLQCMNDKGNIVKSYNLVKEATALGSHGGIVYIGVRDRIQMLKDGQLHDVELKDENDSIVQFPFITAFRVRNDDELYVATLNDGVFKGKDAHFSRVKELSDELTHRFIRDIACKGDTTFVLTHKQLWIHTPQHTLPPISSPGFNRLLVNGSNIVAVADFGLREFFINQDSIGYKDSFQDWSFIPEVSLDCLDRKLVCRSSGVLLIDEPMSKVIEKQHWIEFKPKWEFDSNWKLVLTCAGIALLLLLLVGWQMRRLHKRELESKDEESQKIISLLNRLRRQLDAIRSYGLSNYESIKRQADKVQDDAVQLEKLTLSNKGILDAVDKVKSWQQRWVASIEQMYMSEDLTNKTMDLDSFLDKNIKLNPIECDKRVDDFLDYAASDMVREPFEKHLKEQLADIQLAIAVSKDCKLQTVDVLMVQQEEYQVILGQFNDRPTEDVMVKLLKEIKTLDERCKMTKGIVDLGECIYAAVHIPNGEIEDSLFDLIEENQDLLNKQDPYILRLRSQLRNMANNALSAIKCIYEPWIEGCVDNYLLELVKTSSTTGKLFGKTDESNITLRGVVVALLLPGVELNTNRMKILIDTILGKRSTDYKKDKSEVKKHLLSQQEQLDEYATNNPSSIASIIAAITRVSGD